MAFNDAATVHDLRELKEEFVKHDVNGTNSKEKESIDRIFARLHNSRENSANSLRECMIINKNGIQKDTRDFIAKIDKCVLPKLDEIKSQDESSVEEFKESLKIVRRLTLQYPVLYYLLSVICDSSMFTAV